LLIFIIFVNFSLPQIYEEFYHTVNNADHQKDLKWWSNNHGVNMGMNWPAFIVSISFSFFLFHLKLYAVDGTVFVLILIDFNTFFFLLCYFFFVDVFRFVVFIVFFN